MPTPNIYMYIYYTHLIYSHIYISNQTKFHALLALFLKQVFEVFEA